MNVTLRCIACFALVLISGCTKEAESNAPDAASTAETIEPGAPEPALREAQQAEAVAAELTQVVRKYGAEKQKAPRDLNELVAAGYLPGVPAAPPGKKFAIDNQMRVYLADQ